jgi:HEAT repeat protein
MKRLSERSEKLLLEFSRPEPSWLRAAIVGTEPRDSLYSELENCNEPQLIRYLAPFLFERSGKRPDVAARVIEKLIELLQPHEFVALDQQIRGSLHWYFFERSKFEVSKYIGSPCACATIPCIASMAANGYVREKAVRHLIDNFDRRFLPFLLLRACDWVDKISELAVTGISHFLNRRELEPVLANLYLFTRLELTRGRASFLNREALRLISMPESRPRLLAALKSPDRFIRRTCFELAFRLDDLDRGEVIALGLEDKDVIVRSRSVDAVRSLTSCNLRLKLEAKAIHDVHAIVRRTALALLESESYLNASELVHSLLCDQSSVIRYASRTLIEKNEPSKNHSYFAEQYELLLNKISPARLHSIIAALGEVGTASITQKIVPYLKHTSSSVRRAAIRSLFKLGKLQFAQEFLFALAHDTPAVSREAAVALSSLEARAYQGKLLSLFQKAENTDSKLNILWLVNTLPKWDSIALLLELLNDDCAEIRERIHIYLQMWVERFNKGSTAALHGKLVEVRTSLAKVRSELDPAFANRLEFYLKE